MDETVVMKGLDPDMEIAVDFGHKCREMLL
jgi:hypothetical protein